MNPERTALGKDLCIKEIEDFPVFILIESTSEPWGGYVKIPEGALSAEELDELHRVADAYNEWQSRLKELYHRLYNTGYNVPSRVVGRRPPENS